MENKCARTYSKDGVTLQFRVRVTSGKNRKKGGMEGVEGKLNGNNLKLIPFPCDSYESYSKLSLWMYAGASPVVFLFLHHIAGSYCRAMFMRNFEMSSMTEFLYCGVIYEWRMWGEEEWRRNLVPALAYSYRKTSEVAASFNVHTLGMNSY